MDASVFVHPELFFTHMMFMFTTLVLVYTGVMIARRKKSNKWMIKHKKIMFTASMISLLGVSSEFIFKTINSIPHFSSLHSKGGLTTLILWLLLPVFGLLILKGKKDLRKYHKFLGYTSIITGTSAAGFGIYYLAIRIMAQ
jgi:hypothetical protein